MRRCSDAVAMRPNSQKWKYLALLSNVAVSEPVGNELVALVPPDDKRIVGEVGLSTFTSHFSDQFGRRISPSLIIARNDARMTLESLAAFRNCVAISAIAEAWARFLAYGAQLEALKFSDYFSIYPHQLGRDGRSVIVGSPALLGLDELDEFDGQTTPGISPASANKSMFDQGLLAALLDRWTVKFVSRKESWSDTALFRSLEMAARASAMPYHNQATLEDYGAQIALWVSAHEILTRTIAANSSLPQVDAVLAAAVLKSSALRAKRYTVHHRRQTYRANLLRKLYSEMYFSRNDFIHGNPVTRKNIFPGGHTNKYPLTCFSPIVYRFAVCSHLDLWAVSHTSDSDVFGRVRDSTYEDALMAATRPTARNQREKGKGS
jgi:hypothetical protein